MKNRIVTLVILIAAVVFTNDVAAQKFPKLNKSPMDASTYPDNWRNSSKLVKIVYSRPKLKGRSLAKLAPQGKVWRTGANEAAEITFYKDVNFGGQDVKAGRYTLFTIPGENEWTVILNTAENVWGAFFYKENEDVVRVTAPVSKNSKNVEAFSIFFKGEDNTFNMYLGWGKTVITVPIKG